MEKKKFLARYGPLFGGIYFLAFVFLVTLYKKFQFPTFPGDILIKGGGVTFYIPFTSAAAFAFFIVALIEMYKFFKRF
jgi:hypothetical protein